MMAKQYLRRATSDDTDLLFRWVNDEMTRKNAFDTKQIDYAEHVCWFSEKLDSANCAIYIYCVKDDEPVGQGRIDIEDNRGIISYSIDSEHRLRGHGGKLLKLLEDAVAVDLPHVNTLVARVKKNNATSQRRFEQHGYTALETDDYFEYKKEITRC